MRIRFFGGVLAALLAIAPVAHAEVPPAFSSWVVYWDLPDSLAQARQHAAVFSDFYVFCYQFSPEGQIVPAGPGLAEAVSKLRALNSGKKTIWISAANDVVRGKKRVLKDPEILHNVLAAADIRTAHVQELVALASGYDGLEIDYENLAAQDRDAFSLFIQELSGALHGRQQKLAVVLQPRVNDEIADDAGAIDWKVVAEAADVVKVMAYHLHHGTDKPGPVAPSEWVEKVTRFSLERLPPDKLIIVLTVGGFEWQSGRVGRSTDYKAAMDQARLRGARIQRDAESGSPYFTFKDPGGRHDIWFEDAESLRLKLDVLKKLGVSRVGFWRLGAGDPAFWSSLPR